MVLPIPIINLTKLCVDSDIIDLSRCIKLSRADSQLESTRFAIFQYYVRKSNRIDITFEKGSNV